MHYVGKKAADAQSILVDYARSGRDDSYVGKSSEPYLIQVDEKSIEQVAYACGAALSWRRTNSSNRRAIEAPHAYLFYLLNNTRTYRLYEQAIIAGMPSGRAQLHAGDDFFYYHPIVSGDMLAITAKILPTFDKTGRHGDMRFFADEWCMYNQYNELAARLIRKGVALNFGDSGVLTSPSEQRIEVPVSMDTPSWLHTADVNAAFKVGQVTHLKNHARFNWMSMMAWLAAVDEYSPTHYDPDFAKEHRYGNGRNIVAGPQLASVMVAALEESLSSGWWISAYENVQRRAVYPNELLTSFSKVKSVSDGCATIELWLTDGEGVVKGTGTATVKTATTLRNVLK